VTQHATAFRLKKADEIDKMARAGVILGECLEHLAGMVRPGLTTLDLDGEADTFIRDHGCIPGFLGYYDFPNSLCVSINDEVVHGIPGPRVIEEGDLVSLDCGLILEGWWADSGLSVGCGDISPEARKLLAVTEEALRRGLDQARSGNRIGDIGAAVQTYVESQGFGVVRQYVGHGIGRNMHEPPQVPNYGREGTGNQLKPGYVLAIEPMVTAGSPEVKVLADQWTVVTVDKRLSCYFEHTVAITDEGPRVLTRRPSEIAKAA
jgi:methionyl aminopeptidase